MKKLVWLANLVLWLLGGAELVRGYREMRAEEAARTAAAPAAAPGPVPEGDATVVGPIEHDHGGVPHAHAFGDQEHTHPDGLDADPEFAGEGRLA